MRIKRDLIEKEKDFDNSDKTKSSKSCEFLLCFSSSTLFDKEPINNGSISGLKDTEVDENGMITEENEDKAVNGKTINRSMTILREQVSGGLIQTNNRITNIERRVQKVERNLQRGVANSIAQAGVKFQNIGVNQAVVGAAIGSYKGQQAVAVGVQAAPTEDVRVHGIISVAPNDISESAVSVGASWKFDLR